MAGLDKHFGENAELGDVRRNELLAYLMNNAGDRSEQRRAQKMADSIRPSQSPLRISEVPYFRREHHELSRRQVQDNPKVRSFSNCDACHTGAAHGSFSERELRIPGFGRWED